jgi:FtsP/CotA-like multicopper oxidase with cupredoxin domain
MLLRMMMRHISRRLFLAGATLSVAFESAVVRAQDAYAGQTLVAAKTKTQLLGSESPPTEHWRFKTAGELPILRARQGQEVRFKVLNELDEDLFLHFFGVRGKSEFMTAQVVAREVAGVEIVMTPPDAGTFWFSALTNASKQRELGLTGMLIVEEAQALPFQDVPMVFDDWSLGESGQVEQDFANLDRAAGEGRLGNWFTVNGKSKTRIALEPEKPARLRLLNVANTRTVNVLFKGAEGLVLAKDGQPIVPKPLGAEALNMAPGQRFDVLLTEAQEQVVIALDLFEDIVETAFLDAPDYGRKTLPRDFRLPYNPQALVNVAAARDVTLALEGGIKGGLQKARVGKDELDLRAMLEQGLVWAIGGNSGLGSPPLFEAKKGETLRLTFENKTAFEQALHVHGHVWTEETPPAAVIGPPMPLQWTDTLVVPAKAKKQVFMVADNVGTWAIQSLLAERSDAGLIGAFTVSDMP